MKKVVLALIICLLFWGITWSLLPVSLRAADELPEFKIMTERWEPFQFEKSGQAYGISVDILVLMLEKIGSRQGRKDIQFYPWARGYQTTLKQKNTLLFSTTRTSEREKLFKWVGPIAIITTHLIARKNSKITIKSPADFSKFTFGTVRDDVGEQLLIRNGVKLSQITRNTSNSNTIKMLQAGRLDFISQSFSSFSNDVRSIGLNPDDFECVFELNTGYNSYAFNKETPDKIIEKFQKAFTELEKEGEIRKIFKKYQMAR